MRNTDAATGTAIRMFESSDETHRFYAETRATASHRYMLVVVKTVFGLPHFLIVFASFDN